MLYIIGALLAEGSIDVRIVCRILPALALEVLALMAIVVAIVLLAKALAQKADCPALAITGLFAGAIIVWGVECFDSALVDLMQAEMQEAQAPAAWVELTDRFEELPELPPESEATYVVTDREAGATYVAVVGKGGTDVQLTYLEPAAPDAQGEGDRQ